MHQISYFLSNRDSDLGLDDFLALMLEQADIFLVRAIFLNNKETGTTEGPFAALALILSCLSLSEIHCYKKINDIASLKLVEIFMHLSLGTQASSVLESILPKVLNSSDLHVKSFAYYLWAQTKILQGYCDERALNLLQRAEAGNSYYCGTY
jgi:hypothetical protein